MSRIYTNNKIYKIFKIKNHILFLPKNIGTIRNYIFSSLTICIRFRAITASISVGSSHDLYLLLYFYLFSHKSHKKKNSLPSKLHIYLHYNNRDCVGVNLAARAFALNFVHIPICFHTHEVRARETHTS